MEVKVNQKNLEVNIVGTEAEIQDFRTMMEMLVLASSRLDLNPEQIKIANHIYDDLAKING